MGQQLLLRVRSPRLAANVLQVILRGMRLAYDSFAADRIKSLFGHGG